jgi:hypothetical protein
MPGSVSINEAKGQPVIPAIGDFTMCVIGASSKSPLAAGTVSPLYASPTQLASDYGIGDAVDALAQALTKGGLNTAPPPGAIYQTPATTPGVRGTITVTGVAGTSVVSNTANTHPFGTYQPRARVITGGTIGVAGIVNQYSLDNARTWLPTVALGTATTQKVQVTVGGSVIDTGVQYDFAAGTLITGDNWSEAKTTPPMWGDSDLTTAFLAIGANSQTFGIVAISEPVATGDFSTLTTSLNSILTLYGKKPLLIIRFRDPTSGETDAAYVAAFQTFALANTSDQIACVFGSGWLTDALTGRVYLRSGLPSVLRRLQSFVVRSEERIAHHPGFGGDGPLDDFSLVDSNGNLVGHDEFTLGGIDGPIGSNGGGLTFCYNRTEGVTGTYVSEAPVMYPPLSTVLTLMDRRVASAIERRLNAVAWTMIQGADVFDPTTFVLDEDLRDAMAAKMRQSISKDFAKEIQNPDDPNLVSVNPTVSVVGSQVTIGVTVNDRLFGYTNTINIVLTNAR